MTKELRETHSPAYEAINWNNVPELELMIWNKLTTNFWLPEKVNLASDVPSWNKLSADEQDTVMKVFTGLTMLDTIQSRFGAPSLMADATSLFEEAVYANIVFMEAVHAKSYSSIFSTLSNTKDINKSFRWAEDNDYLRKKEEIIVSYYRDNDDPLAAHKRKIASTLLESFLFYSGFYVSLHHNSQARLPAVYNIISLIIRDESVHGHYIGTKYQQGIVNLSSEEKDELKNFTYTILMDLYDNEVKYTQELYDRHGLTEEVIGFLKYNANKALSNLGYEPLFPNPSVPAEILGQLQVGTESHDFFSSAGNSYAISPREELAEEEWDF